MAGASCHLDPFITLELQLLNEIMTIIITTIMHAVATLIRAIYTCTVYVYVITIQS